MTASHLRCCLFVLLFTALLGAPFAPGYAAETYDAGMRAYDAGDHAKALEIWGPLAEGGNKTAQYSLGKLLEIGGGQVQPDLGEAAKWYQRAADQGVSAAQNNLGLMYAQGRGVPRDVARAAQLWLVAAEKDHTIAQFNLGLAYFRGEGVAKNQSQATGWFRRAGELGLASAQYAMGQVIRMGLVSGGNEAEALGWYEMAAAQGDKKAQAQAEELRKTGVKPRAPGVKTAAKTAAKTGVVAAKAPAPPPPKPAAKPKRDPAKQPAAVQAAAKQPKAEPPPPEPAVIEKPEPAVQAAVLAKPKPEPEPRPAPARTQVSATPPAPGPPAPGPYRIWLISLKDQAEAGRYLRAAQAKHPEIFAQAPGAVARSDLGKAGVVHRVVAGGLSSRQAARDLCRRLRAEEPGAFCKVLAD